MFVTIKGERRLGTINFHDAFLQMIFRFWNVNMVVPWANYRFDPSPYLTVYKTVSWPLLSVYKCFKTILKNKTVLKIPRNDHETFIQSSIQTVRNGELQETLETERSNA